MLFDPAVSHELLFKQYSSMVYHAAYCITKDQFLSEDAVQETFLKVFHNIHTLENKQKIEGWLYAIATRTAIDLIRKQKKSIGTLMENSFIEAKISIGPNAPDKEMEFALLKEEIYGQIRILPQDFRQVLLLKLDQQLTDEEIAHTLHLKLGTVKSRLNRSIKKLRKSLI